MRAHRLQIVGPFLIFAVVLAAEAAAYALALSPSSSLLWYLNLEVFSLLRKSRLIVSDYCSLPFAQFILAAGPIAVIGMFGLALRNNLCMAISSNLSFVFAAFLGYGWYAWSSHGHHAASLTFDRAPAGGSFYLFAVLGTAAFGSFVASHFAFLSAIRATDE